MILERLRRGTLLVASCLYLLSFLLPAWDNRQAPWNHMSFNNPPGAGTIVYGFGAFLSGLGAFLLLIPAWLANPFFVGGSAALYWKRDRLAAALGGAALLFALTGLFALLQGSMIHEHRFLSAFHIWTASMAALTSGALLSLIERRETSGRPLFLRAALWTAAILLPFMSVLGTNLYVDRLVEQKFDGPGPNKPVQRR